MANDDVPHEEPSDELTPEEDRADRRTALVIVGVAALAVIVALVWWLLRDDADDEPVATTSTTSTTTPTSTTETTTPTTESTFAPSIDDEALAAVVWPDPSSSRRFDDPVAAARSFAVELVGFSDLVLGQMQSSGDDAGEVEVRAVSTGPATTVQVRQFGDDGSWWVTGARTDDIDVTSPTAGALVESPLRPEGRSRAFEGTVQVDLYEDGRTEPIGSGYVTGGATEELDAFSGEVGFDARDARFGAVVFRIDSAEDGRVWQATVVRVRFA